MVVQWSCNNSFIPYPIILNFPIYFASNIYENTVRVIMRICNDTMTELTTLRIDNEMMVDGCESKIINFVIIVTITILHYKCCD